MTDPMHNPIPQQNPKIHRLQCETCSVDLEDEYCDACESREFCKEHCECEPFDPRAEWGTY